MRPGASAAARSSAATPSADRPALICAHPSNACERGIAGCASTMCWASSRASARRPARSSSVATSVGCASGSSSCARRTSAALHRSGIAPSTPPVVIVRVRIARVQLERAQELTLGTLPVEIRVNRISPIAPCASPSLSSIASAFSAASRARA